MGVARFRFSAAAICASAAPTPSHAQVGLANSGPFDQREIATVTVRIANPGPRRGLRPAHRGRVRRGVQLFPGQRYSDEVISLALGQVQRRNPQIARLDYPCRVVRDDGTELTSNAILTWREERHVESRYIALGKPMQSGFVESFNGRLRDECPNGHLFIAPRRARQSIAAWREDHDHHRALREKPNPERIPPLAEDDPGSRSDDQAVSSFWSAAQSQERPPPSATSGSHRSPRTRRCLTRTLARRPQPSVRDSR